jgi:glycosyltransferase involved in cell wall biosynthesis
LSYLNENGFEYAISYVISEKDDAVFYARGKLLRKFVILMKSIYKRSRDLGKADSFDIIFIYREALMLGSTYFERKLKKRKKKLIFDFDDAIWLNDVSEGNKYLGWLKNPLKTDKLIKLSDLVFAGNKFLAAYARQFNENVIVIPTTLNIEIFKPGIENFKKEAICIGWTGSSTTLKHFKLLIPCLKKIKEKYGNKVFFKIISDVPYISQEIDLVFCKWNLSAEIEDLSEIDIGIMPLPDDEWAKGKCGFKGLQYMSLEIPTIMSPVGVNTEIISDGINGFLAGNDEEWIDKLSLLVESPELREKLGKEGRKTVIDKYSFQAQKQNYLKYFNELLDKKDEN